MKASPLSERPPQRRLGRPLRIVATLGICREMIVDRDPWQTVIDPCVIGRFEALWVVEATSRDIHARREIPVTVCERCTAGPAERSGDRRR